MECRFTIYHIIFFSILIIIWGKISFAQAHKPDSLKSRTDQTEKYNNFYDTLKSRADQKKFTKLLHNAIFSSGKSGSKQVDSLRNIRMYDGKTIGQINIIRLDVFGPSLNEPARKAALWYEKAGNMLHTRSDLHNIRKNLLFKKGGILQSSEIYENERLLRALPYIRDVRFFVEPDSVEKDKVNITLLTQDRFSIGVTGDVLGWKSAAVELYNRNIFGVGHELSARFVGHLTKEPFMGLETFYRINNIDGRFITLSAGYMNTYLNEGALLVLNKDFIRVSSPWGYGIAGHFFNRAHELPDELHLRNSPLFGYQQWSGWAGRNFQIGWKGATSQMTIAGQYIHRHYSDRPDPLPNGEQYYQNSNLYLAGFTWSRRTFTTDELIYAYGITEDIPKGFKNEWVIGFDDNEFGKRYYSHINISNANLLPHKSSSYLYLSAGYSSYFKSGKTEQGMVEFNSRFVSRLFSSGNARFREFVNINYRLGINRFEKEKLLFEKNNLIRGFESEQVIGKQRLSINAESVYFQRRDFYRFNLAFFIFADLGMMQSEGSLIFRGKFYSGLGIGMRLHNESLVLKTLQIRFSFYPNHPEDVGFVGFLLNEQTPQSFYTFQPGPPTPRRFE